MNATTKPRNDWLSTIAAIYKSFDWRSASLLVPAVAYTAGLILYSGEGLFPGTLTMHAARLVGAWLMVAGAEGGTLSAVIEVARKIGIGRARWYDYAGIVVSMFATVFNLLLVWSRESTLTDKQAWELWMLRNGALADILAQVGDFYAGAAFELGLYTAYIREERREAALQAERDALGVYRARLQIERERRELDGANTGESEQLRRQVADLTNELNVEIEHSDELRAALQAANTVIDNYDAMSEAPGQLPDSDIPANDNGIRIVDRGSSVVRSNDIRVIFDVAGNDNDRQPPDTDTRANDNDVTTTGKLMTLEEWRVIRDTLGNDKPDNAAALNRWLSDSGYAELSYWQARRWANDKRPANADN